jgi:hypothetical protein
MIMKTYEEMIAFTVQNCTEGAKYLRYNKWVANMLLVEVYSKSPKQVSADIEAGIKQFENAQKEMFRAKNRAEHESRRLANLAKQKSI